MRILIDANSLLNSALLGGVDPDNGEKITDENGRVHQVNGYQWGVDKFFDEIERLCEKFEAAPRQMVLVWDGENSKQRRRTFLPGYKVGRDKVAEVSTQLNKAREIVSTEMLNLGAHIAEQYSLEADDLLAYIAKTSRGERNIIATSDGDLTVLVDENTDVWRLGELNKNPYGPFPHKYIRLYKTLVVGDPSDKIPGAKGFGDAAWCDLVRVFGFDGLDQLERDIQNGTLHTLAENVAELKCLQKIIDAKDLVTTCWRVAGLMDEDVNTGRKPWNLRAGVAAQWVGGEDQVPALRRFYGTKTLVTADNYDAVYKRLAAAKFEDSPFVALDIETSSTEESDEWLEAKKNANGGKGKDRIDVLGHELTGMSLTFGANTQHTIYMSVDHADTNNISVDQCRQVCELIPQNLHTVIQNRQFEFSVLYRTWGEVWKSNGWNGFVPNALDTKVGASYVDENLKKGLKSRSLHHLGYKQATYEETTTKSGAVGSLKGGQVTKVYKKEVEPAVYGEGRVDIDELGNDVFTPGALITPAKTQDWEDRQYKMNQLTAKEVFDYGCDDTICTAALHTHYKLVMDIEQAWDTYLAVETLPEYLTTLAFVEGIPLNTPVLKAMSERDDIAYDKGWKTLRDFLMTKGWAGTVCPEFEGSIEPADAKLAVQILLGDEFSTKKRKLNAIAADIREQFPDNGDAIRLAQIVEQNDVKSLNEMVKAGFTGEPKINFGSPKQLQNLFYNVMGMTPRLVNKMTDKQRAENTVMAEAFRERSKAKKAGREPVYTAEQLQQLISKSSTDDTAVDTAIARDTHLSPEALEVLKAYQSVRQIMTRRSLYYVPYRSLPHWRDGLIHPSLNQAEAVTRRYSANDPNVQQQPSHGEGVELRKTLKARKKDHVVISMDFNGQELRIQADQSGDAALTSCYVGDNLRDVHTLTAVSAAILVFGKEINYEQFKANLKSNDPVVAEEYSKMRKDAKTVNFAAAYGAMSETVATGLKSDEDTAQQFLDARSAAFPGLETWAEALKEEIRDCGFMTTMMGARRHLAAGIYSENQWDRAGAERQGVNHKIQGSAGEQTKLAMARMWEAGVFTGKYDAHFMFPVHDELVSSVHRDQAYDFIVEAHALMVMPYSTMQIPVVSTISMGSSFLCEIEIGPVPDRALIEAAIEKIFHEEKVPA